MLGREENVELNLQAVLTVCDQLFEQEGSPRFIRIELEQEMQRRIAPLKAGNKKSVNVATVQNWARQFAGNKVAIPYQHKILTKRQGKPGNYAEESET